MLRILFHFLINILIILGLSLLLPFFNVDNAWAAAWFIVILTLLNWTILPIIKLLTLPINFLTLGLFNAILNLLVIIVVANSVRGIEITGSFWEQVLNAVIISLSLAIGNSLVNMIDDND